MNNTDEIFDEFNDYGSPNSVYLISLLIHLYKQK